MHTAVHIFPQKNLVAIAIRRPKSVSRQDIDDVAAAASRSGRPATTATTASPGGLIVEAAAERFSFGEPDGGSSTLVRT